MTKMLRTSLRKFNHANGHPGMRTLDTVCPCPDIQCVNSSTVRMPIRLCTHEARNALCPTNTNSFLKMDDIPPSPTLSAVPTSSEPAVSFSLDPALINEPHTSVHVPTNDFNGSPTISSGIDSIQEMTMQSYDIRDRIEDEFTSDTTTVRRYKIYVREYTDWWGKNEFALNHQNPARKPIPAFPITPAKAVHFLNYTMKRPRVSFSD